VRRRLESEKIADGRRWKKKKKMTLWGLQARFLWRGHSWRRDGAPGGLDEGRRPMAAVAVLGDSRT
jgi:hypothetical protein